MTVDLSKYRLRRRVLLSSNLKLIFQSLHDETDIKVLELDSVAGFFDQLDKTDQLRWLEVRGAGGSYNFDLSLRLKKSELVNNQEIFIFLDDNRIDFGFRCSAEKAVFRDWAEHDRWLK